MEAVMELIRKLACKLKKVNVNKQTSKNRSNHRKIKAIKKLVGRHDVSI